MKFSVIPLFALTLSLLTAALQAADAPAAFKVSELSFNRPTSWEWVPAGGMRQAQLKVVDNEKKETAEVVFFYFGPGNGGGVKANVDRWIGQFKEPKEELKPQVEETSVGTHKITYVTALGTYNSGMPGGPKTPLANHALLGAIVEAPQGCVFVRLTGPAGLAKASKSDFRKMVESGLK